jgi:hypothetical protein
MFLEGFTKIVGVCGLKDFRAEEILLWLGLPTLTIEIGWLGGYRLQQPTWPLFRRLKVRSKLSPFG